MSEFKVGDVVEVLEEWDDNSNIVGKKGIVVEVDYKGSDENSIGIEFFDKVDGHTCGGKAESEHGYYVANRLCKLICKKERNMSELNYEAAVKAIDDAQDVCSEYKKFARDIIDGIFGKKKEDVKFKVGDVVEGISSMSGTDMRGRLGIIVDRSTDGRFAVNFFSKFSAGHDCNGKAPEGFGFFMDFDTMRLVVRPVFNFSE